MGREPFRHLSLRWGIGKQRPVFQTAFHDSTDSQTSSLIMAGLDRIKESDSAGSSAGKLSSLKASSVDQRSRLSSGPGDDAKVRSPAPDLVAASGSSGWSCLSCFDSGRTAPGNEAEVVRPASSPPPMMATERYQHVSRAAQHASFASSHMTPSCFVLYIETVSYRVMQVSRAVQSLLMAARKNR